MAVQSRPCGTSTMQHSRTQTVVVVVQSWPTLPSASLNHTCRTTGRNTHWLATPTDGQGQAVDQHGRPALKRRELRASLWSPNTNCLPFFPPPLSSPLATKCVSNRLSVLCIVTLVGELEGTGVYKAHILACCSSIVARTALTRGALYVSVLGTFSI